MKFDLHRMQLLKELSYRGTVSAVASALSYSASAISQQLAVLEKEIGVPLLVPDGRSVRLTPQAEILVKRTSGILEQLESVEAEITASLRSVVGTVHLASIQTAALACVPTVLESLAETAPGLSVRFTQAEPEVAIPGLLARQFDIVCDEAFADFSPNPPEELHQDALIVDHMRVAFQRPPAGIAASEARLADFATQPWVMELPGSPGRAWAVAVCRRAGFEPRIVHETSDSVVQAQLVAAGHAIAFLPDLMWLDREPQFNLRLMDPAHARTILTTCRAGSQDRPSIKAVRDSFRLLFEARSPGGSDHYWPR